MQLDYHRKNNNAYDLYKQLKQINKQDMFIIWDYATSKTLTNAEKTRFKKLISDKYDLMNNLEDRKLSDFVYKFLIVRYGKKGHFVNS